MIVEMAGLSTLFYSILFYPNFILFYLLHLIPIVYSANDFDNILNLHIAPYFCPDAHSKNSMKASTARNVNVK